MLTLVREAPFFLSVCNVCICFQELFCCPVGEFFFFKEAYLIDRRLESLLMLTPILDHEFKLFQFSVAWSTGHDLIW